VLCQLSYSHRNVFDYSNRFGRWESDVTVAEAIAEPIKRPVKKPESSHNTRGRGTITLILRFRACAEFSEAILHFQKKLINQACGKFASDCFMEGMVDGTHAT
jgi:hypothetical protein